MMRENTAKVHGMERELCSSNSSKKGNEKSRSFKVLAGSSNERERNEVHFGRGMRKESKRKKKTPNKIILPVQLDGVHLVEMRRRGRQSWRGERSGERGSHDVLAEVEQARCRKPHQHSTM